MTPEEQWLEDLAAEQDEYTEKTLEDYAVEAAALGGLALALWKVIDARRKAGEPVTAEWMSKLPQYKALAQKLVTVIVRGSLSTEARLPAALERASKHADKALRARAALMAGAKARSELTAGQVLKELTAPKRAAAIEARKNVAVAALKRRRQTLAIEAAKTKMLTELVTRGKGNKPMSKAEAQFIVAQRVKAAARHSLTVLNTETANVGRQMVLDLVGDDGDWQWITREDSAVCGRCAGNNGLVFPASVMFDQQHPGCRCLSVPAR